MKSGVPREPATGGETRWQARAGGVLSRRPGGRGPMRLLPFLETAFIAAVAYIDSGTFATNIEGGATFGYRLYHRTQRLFARAVLSRLKKVTR